MEKKDKTPENTKPAAVTPALKQARWPGQGGSGGIKSAQTGHDRKGMGRGAARGR